MLFLNLFGYTLYSIIFILFELCLQDLFQVSEKPLEKITKSKKDGKKLDATDSVEASGFFACNYFYLNCCYLYC
jgi:hypothetical protein